MPRPSKPFALAFITTAAVALTMPGYFARAQQTEPPTPSNPAAAQPQQQQPLRRQQQIGQPAEEALVWTKPLTLDFPGGNGAEYVAMLRKAAPDGNIVVLGDIDQIRIPAVRLHSVDLFSALKVLDSLPETQDGRNVDVKIQTIQQRSNQEPVFAVTAQVYRMPQQPRPTMPQTTVISMADLLGENLKPADALMAIDTALGLIRSEPPVEPAQIKFHEQTGLLIARGTPEQVASIQEVIGQLRERAGTLETRLQRATAERQAQERAHQDSNLVTALRQTNDETTRALTQERTKAEILQKAMDDMQHRLATLEEENRVLRDRLAGGRAPTPGEKKSDKP